MTSKPQKGMIMTTTLEDRDSINELLASLERKYQKLLDEGHSSTFAIQDVSGAFAQQFPVLSKVLGEILLARAVYRTKVQDQA